ncbi:MAG TPA: TonB-dependent receptor plug domain-containing protein, partial [Rhodothermales bacterium]|nr:TonB-dependent receptor plug domain-containing protein [Rhodothermales bacterium]
MIAPVVSAQPVEIPVARPGVQIITAADIEQAGVVRLGDLFALIDDWYASSMDGFAWEVSANGLGAFEQDNWALLIDGQPVDMRILDAKNINLLPLSPAQIAYVEVINTPALVEGVMASGGALHIHTRQPFDGPAIQGGFAAGNEIGDPG